MKECPICKKEFNESLDYNGKAHRDRKCCSIKCKGEFRRRWRVKWRKEIKLYQRNYYLNNKEKFLRSSEDAKEYYKRHREHIRLYNKKYTMKLRLKALSFLTNYSTVKCVYCGCSDLRIIEINHKVIGAGVKRLDKGRRLYRGILNGKLCKEEYEVSCRVCNAVHYVKEKFNLIFKVNFIGEDKIGIN